MEWSYKYCFPRGVVVKIKWCNTWNISRYWYSCRYYNGHCGTLCRSPETGILAVKCTRPSSKLFSTTIQQRIASSSVFSPLSQGLTDMKKERPGPVVWRKPVGHHSPRDTHRISYDLSCNNVISQLLLPHNTFLAPSQMHDCQRALPSKCSSITLLGTQFKIIGSSKWKVSSSLSQKER